MTMDAPTPPPGMPTLPGGGVPHGGVFAVSEVLPVIVQARQHLDTLRTERREARERAAQAKAHARKVRANLIVHLRVWGNDGTSGLPIKTSAERQEWADADPEVQQAELDADLAQTLAIAAGDALTDAQAYFATLQTLAGMERDSFRAERAGR